MSVDKSLIVWDILQDHNDPSRYVAKHIHVINTKNYIDIAISSNRLATIG